MDFAQALISLLGASWSSSRVYRQIHGAALSLPDRLAMFPKRRLPIHGRVTIHWNGRHVPFIEAERDVDLPVGLGMVHAHLRLGQMEVLRRIARGRVAEMAGPAAIDLDHLLRILNFGRAAPAILSAMPADSREWLDGFVCGLNAYVDGVETLPFEFRAAGLAREPWTAEDVLTLGRFVSLDVTWLVWFQLLAHVADTDWAALWERLTTEGAGLPYAPEPGSGLGLAIANSTFSGLGRWGSNSFAVAAERSATGGALLASDPHLGITLPNCWLLAGYQSPSHNALGLMIPGLPVIALGRNRRIAWGATNLHAASSDIYDVSGLSADDVAQRRERIRCRWWSDRDVTVRDSALGPVVTDSRLLADPFGRTLALRWAGYLPSDELTALLQVSQARDWPGFRRALQGFGVPGQTFTYADAHGHVGQLYATQLPRRPPVELPELVMPASASSCWDHTVTADDLPAQLDPPDGIAVSANNRPLETNIRIGCFFSPDDRFQRLRYLLRQKERLAVADVSAAQQDVYVPSIVAFRDEFLARLKPSARASATLDALAAWDGRYAAESTGALAMERLTYHLARNLSGQGRARAYWATWCPRALVRRDVAKASAAVLEAVSDTALAAADRAVKKSRTWGNEHRLRLMHLFGMLPVLGHLYRFGDFPAAGNSETVMKTAYGFVSGRHAARYGSTARHISDLSDPDRNYFCLLGGQDGWPSSTTFIDQLPDWQAGRYHDMPLRVETARARFPHTLHLTP